MTYRHDVTATLRGVSIVGYPDDHTVEIECNAGGVIGQRLTVTREWLREHSPETFEVDP
jgi:hypothetical protein